MAQKPILVARQEFIAALDSILRTYNLPAFVLEPILVETLNDVRSAINQQYQSELQEYQQAIEKETEREATENIELEAVEPEQQQPAEGISESESR